MSRTPPVRTQLVRQSINNPNIRFHRVRAGKLAPDTGRKGTADVRARVVAYVVGPRLTGGCIAEFETEEVVAVLVGSGTGAVEQVVEDTGEAVVRSVGGYC